MILSIDVDYRNDYAVAVGIEFNDWNDKTPSNIYYSKCYEYGEYISGQFYKRELPCIKALINEHNLSPSLIIVNGYVYLEDNKPGLGYYVYDTYNVPVIGIASKPYKNPIDKYIIYRGNSKTPIYISSVGMPIEEAKVKIRNMYGKYRMPYLIKLTDTKTRLY